MLPINLWRRRRSRPDGPPSDPAIVLLVETVSQRRAVAHACGAALEAGIVPGTPLATARAAASGPVVVEPHDEPRTRRALRALALWCHRFSPVVAQDRDHGLCLDIRGCAHLFGGEHAMIARVRNALLRHGFEARIAVAPTPAAARALARYGDDGTVVEPAGLAGAVAGLPLAALEALPAEIDGLLEVHVRCVGELLALPRAAVAARFGAGVLGTVDRLLGRSPEVIDPLRPTEPIRADLAFDGPCASVEAIGSACREALGRMVRLLTDRAVGVTRWVATLHRSDIEPLAITISHAAPSADADHLWKLLAPRLERANLGFGVEALSVGAARVRRLGDHQRRWWGEDQGRHEPGRSRRADALIDELANRLGEGAVSRAELRECHVPEAAFVYRSVIAGRAGPADAVRACDADRPTRLFERPVVARVVALSPDGPVSRVEWNAGVHDIGACIGPERLRGRWWEGERLMRDYFKVQDRRGRWLWLYRDLAATGWFVHGVWS